MSSNLKVNTILPSTGTTIGIGTVGGLINIVGNIDVNSTSGISTFNGLEISGIVTAKAGAAVTYYGDGSNLTGITDNVVTINNNANNRIITGSGSANTLEGEANLTFNGGATGDAQLTVHAEQNDSGADSELILETSNDFATSVIMFKDSTAEAGSVAYNHGDNYIKFSTNGTNGGTERVRIDSSGRVLIGLTASQTTDSNAHSKLQVASSAGPNIGLGNNSTDINNNGRLGTINYNSNHGGTYHEVVTIRAAADADHASNSKPSRLEFYTTQTGNTQSTERLRITSTGELGVNTTAPVEKLGVAGNMRFVNATGATKRISALPSGSYSLGTTGGSAIAFHRISDGGGGSDEIAFETHWQGNRHAESCRITKQGNLKFPSGQGIDFSATGDHGSMSSELLDDYEEGNFTPFFRGDASTGSYGYSRQIGRYTKIGQRVFFNFYLTLSAVNANASGNLMIYGLPYTSEGSNMYNFAGVAYYYGFNGVAPQSGLIDISNTRLYLYQNHANSNIINSTPAGALTTTSSIIMGGQYSTG